MWREEIRTIAQELNGASYKETLDALVRLKMRINAFGNKEKDNLYMYDAHIWKVIAEIEEKKCSKKLLRLKQKRFCFNRNNFFEHFFSSISAITFHIWASYIYRLSFSLFPNALIRIFNLTNASSVSL